MLQKLYMLAFAAFLCSFSAFAQTNVGSNSIVDLAFTVQPGNNIYFTGKHQGKQVNLVRNGPVGSGKWIVYTGTVSDRVRLTIDDKKGLQEILAMDMGQRMTVNPVGQERIEYRLYEPDRRFVIGSVLYRSNGRWLQGLMRTEAFGGYSSLTKVSDVTLKIALDMPSTATRLSSWLQGRWKGINLVSVAHAQDDGGLIGGFFSPSAQSSRDSWSAPLHVMFTASMTGMVGVAVQLAGQTVAAGETVAVGSALVAATPFLVAVGVGVGVGLATDRVYNWVDARNLGDSISVNDVYNRLVAGTRFSNQVPQEAPPEVRPSTLASAPTHLAAPTSLIDLADKFDALDQQDFRTALDEATVCTRNRSFDCTEVRLAKASKLANGASDRWLITVARQNLEKQKAKVAEEVQQLAAQERQRAYKDMQRVTQADLQRKDEQSQSSGSQWGKSRSLLAGLDLGGLSKLSPELQGKEISGILQDSTNGQTGISNFQASTASSGGAGTGGGSRQASCGSRGQIIRVKSPDEIPSLCTAGREDNWAVGPETEQSLCNRVVSPYSNGSPIPIEKVKNMSACFCGPSPISGQMKCLSYYDRTY